MKFVTNLNLNQNELQNGKFQVVASDPSTGNFEGRLIYNSTEKTIKYFNGTSWEKLIIGVETAGSASAALTINESNGTISIEPNLATTSNPGVMSTSDKSLLDNASSSDGVNTLVKRNGDGRFQVAEPVNALDAANKAYVDAARSGLDVKESVHVATTGPVNLASDLNTGDTIDGHVLETGDRVLVKDQVTASENGIYVVSASGTAQRATDADTSAEVTSGMFTFVTNGTTYGDTGWVLTTNNPITLGTTPLTFAQFSGTGQITAGEALEKVGSTLNVLTDGVSIHVVNDELAIADGAAGAGLSASAGVLSIALHNTGGLEIDGDELQIKIDEDVDGLTTTVDGLALDSSIAGTGLTFTAGVLSVDAVDLTSASAGGVTGVLPIANGGTNATDESTARTNLAYTSPTGANTSTPVLARISSKVVGDGANTSFSVTHNFGTRAVVVQVYDSSSYDTVIADVVRTTTDTVTVSFSVAPSSNAYTVVVTG